jgi:hypothetical protein
LSTQLPNCISKHLVLKIVLKLSQVLSGGTGRTINLMYPGAVSVFVLLKRIIWNYLAYVSSCVTFMCFGTQECDNGPQIKVKWTLRLSWCSAFYHTWLDLLLLSCHRMSVHMCTCTGLLISPSGISDPCGTVAGMVTSKGSMSTGERHSKFLSYLTGALYVHPWWRDKCQILANSKAQTPYLFPVHAMFCHDCPPSGETCKYATVPSTKKKLREFLCLLICSFLSCLSWLLRSRVRKSRRDLWITLYISLCMAVFYFIIYVSIAALWRRNPECADTCWDSCCALGHDKGHSVLAYTTHLILNRNRFLVIILIFLS